MIFSRRQVLAATASFCCARPTLAQVPHNVDEQGRFVSCGELRFLTDGELKEMREVLAEEYHREDRLTSEEAAALRVHPEWGRWNPLRLRHSTSPRPLRIGFNSYHAMNEIVRLAVEEWQAHMDIGFVFAETDLDILVQNDTAGNSSRIGVVSRLFAQKGVASLKLQDFHGYTNEVKFGVTLHEVGHALGLIHEHQHPESGIKFNEDAVYAYFKSKYNWSRSTTIFNVLQPYGSTGKFAVGARTEFDPLSIMMYELPIGLFQDPRDALKMNLTLSEFDKILIDNIY